MRKNTLIGSSWSLPSTEPIYISRINGIPSQAQDTTAIDMTFTLRYFFDIYKINMQVVVGNCSHGWANQDQHQSGHLGLDWGCVFYFLLPLD